jgi:hypothetical protein
MQSQGPLRFRFLPEAILYQLFFIHKTLQQADNTADGNVAQAAALSFR